MTSKKKLFVLALNASDARDAVQELDIPLSSVRYVNNDIQLRGLTQPMYIVTERFWERHDWMDIWQCLQVSFKYPLPPPTNVLANSQPVAQYTPHPKRAPRPPLVVNLPLLNEEQPEPVPAAREPKANGKKTVKSIRIS